MNGFGFVWQMTLFVGNKKNTQTKVEVESLNLAC